MLKRALLVVGVLGSILLLLPGSVYATKQRCCVCYECPTAAGGLATSCFNPLPPDTSGDVVAGEEDAEPTITCNCPVGCKVSVARTSCPALGALCVSGVRAPAVSSAVLTGLAGLLVAGGVFVVRRRSNS